MEVGRLLEVSCADASFLRQPRERDACDDDEADFAGLSYNRLGPIRSLYGEAEPSILQPGHNYIE